MKSVAAKPVWAVTPEKLTEAGRQVDRLLGGHNSLELKQESAQAKAEPIIQ